MKLRRLLISLLGIGMIYLAYQFFPILSIPPLPESPNLRIAVWLDVEWSMEAHSEAEYQALAENLQKHQVSDVFVYTSYLRADSTLNPTFDHAHAFNTAMQTYLPEVRFLAWFGLPVDQRLQSSEIQTRIADFARLSVRELGFDGFHLNAEPVANENSDFLALLSLIQASLPETALLSVTGHFLRVPEGLVSVPYPLAPQHWTTDYLQVVAQHTDQIALMAYDSSLTFPRDYRTLLAYQTKSSVAALADSSTELFIGISTSEEWTSSHQTQAETLNSALAGLTLGYAPRLTGIAIYPAWETSESEWQTILAWRGQD